MDGRGDLDLKMKENELYSIENDMVQSILLLLLLLLYKIHLIRVEFKDMTINGRWLGNNVCSNTRKHTSTHTHSTSRELIEKNWLCSAIHI